MNWMKRGDDAAVSLKQAEAESKAKSMQNKSMWRFRLNDGEEARVTFVDGELTKNGNIDWLTYREHQVFMNGKWNNHFVCTEPAEKCPICESGDSPSWVAVLTVIDHREYKSKKDPGKSYKNQPRLFVMKQQTAKLLQNLGEKRKGLAGCTFDILRAGDKSPAVGSSFDFIEKNSVKDLQAQFMEKDEHGKMKTVFVPADYEKEIVYRSAKELMQFGFASSGTSIGQADMSHDLEKEL
jgi:hypothetical protein